MIRTAYSAILIIILSVALNGCTSETKEKEKSYITDVILVDSIKTSGGKNIYWFKLRNMLGSSRVSYIGLYPSACQIDTSDILASGGLIYQIKLLSPRKLEITSDLGFNTLKKTSEIEFADKRFEYGMVFKKNSMMSEISLDSLCK